MKNQCWLTLFIVTVVMVSGISSVSGLSAPERGRCSDILLGAATEWHVPIMVDDAGRISASAEAIMAWVEAYDMGNLQVKYGELVLNFDYDQQVGWSEDPIAVLNEAYLIEDFLGERLIADYTSLWVYRYMGDEQTVLDGAESFGGFVLSDKYDLGIANSYRQFRSESVWWAFYYQAPSPFPFGIAYTGGDVTLCDVFYTVP